MKHIKGSYTHIAAAVSELSKFGLDDATKFVAVGDPDGNIWGGGATREECEDDLVRGLENAGEEYHPDAYTIFPLVVSETDVEGVEALS